MTTKKADEMEARAFAALERYGCTPQSMPEQGDKCVLYIRMPAAWGRARFEPDECFIEALNEWRSGKITCAKAAGRCGMSKGAFRYHAGNYER